MRILVVLGLAALVHAQPTMTPPRAGFMVDAAQSLRPVLGVPGTLLLGDAAVDEVVSFAFSGKCAIVKTSSSMRVLDASGQVLFAMDAADGPALFAFTDDGAPALAYVAGRLLRWNGSGFEALAFNADALQGEVLAVGAGPVFLVQREDAVWRVESETGAQSLLVGVHAPVLLRGDGVAYADETAVVLRAAGGPERRIDTQAAIGGVRWMGDGMIGVTEKDSTRQFAVRITPGRENVSQLPEVQ